MPGCAAIGCNNRSEKGYIMKCFPRDPKLRKLWQEKVARADWEPSNNSFLCHVHFEPQEWSITQTGRIRLKKNAVPTIFTITSTRKSPKKRQRTMDAVKKDHCDDSMEYLENDTEQSSIDNFEDKDSDYQDTKESTISSVDYQTPLRNKETKKTDKKSVLYQNVNNDGIDDDVIMISEDNYAEIGGLDKQNFLIQANAGISAPGQVSMNLNTNSNGGVKCEEVGEGLLDDSYDEIEERLKQICDGGLTGDEDIGMNKNNNVASVSGKRTDENMGICYINNVHSGKNEIGHILADKRENVEIIFGTESGDEKTFLSSSNNCFPSEIDTVQGISLTVTGAKGQERKIEIMEDIEENFGRDEVHVIPNIRAAMKRKRRTRQEIMKSIKKSIGSASDQDLNTLSNSEVSDNTTDKDTETGKGMELYKRRLPKEDLDSAEGIKFTIKVTGDPDDVTDIIEELSSKTTKRRDVEKPRNCSNNENGTFVTTVITIEDYPLDSSGKELKQTIKKEECEYSEIKDQYVFSSCSSKSKLSQNLGEKSGSKYSRNSLQYSDEDSKSIDICVNSQAWSPASNVGKSTSNNDNLVSEEFKELRNRIKLQETVIEKLTDQLIVYKNLENNLRNKNAELQAKTKQMETPSNRTNTRSMSLQLSINSGKKNLESKQRLIEDLSNRINYLEEMNKKLMKTVTLESQQKRNLEGQVKQRDNQIKELNWKLEKASKYLERAEKNTNTYRRKMLNMQTIMRRKKLLDDKMSRFNELMFDRDKGEYTEKALSTAIEIRKTCGRVGYNKLINWGFPLPPLRSLRRKLVNDTYSDLNQSDVEYVQRTPGRKITVKIEQTEGQKEEQTRTETRNSGIPEAVIKKTEYEGTETVTGTVQDIFDENNDGDDFNTNELREDFILQLNTVM